MERAAFVIYMIVLVLSILLFGGMHTYVYTFMSLGTLVATALVFWKSIRKDYKTGGRLFRFPMTSLNLFFFVFLLFLVLQIVPMSELLLNFLSPEAKIVGDKSLPAAGLVGRGHVVGAWFTLSSYIYPVRLSILRFTVYGLFFLGLIKVLNSKKRIDLAISLIHRGGHGYRVDFLRIQGRDDCRRRSHVLDGDSFFI